MKKRRLAVLNIRGKAVSLEDKVSVLEGQCLCLGVDILSWYRHCARVFARR